MVPMIRNCVSGLVVLSILVVVALLVPRQQEPIPEEPNLSPHASAGKLVIASPRECAILRQRAEARGQIAQQLRLGEISFAEAVAKFRDLNARPADLPDQYYQLFPGATDDEKIARQLICWVLNSVEASSPSETQRLTALLEANLKEYLHAGPALKIVCQD